MADDTSVDLDTLQAQIDLSMSFADNLVSSWFTSPNATTSSSTSNKKIEQEILEQMRLPPRLGVGASVSDSAATSSREVNKLKGRLVGKKRPRDEDNPSSARSPLDDSDDAESRASAIHKKARADPFGPSSKAKKKLDPLAIPPPSTNGLKLAALPKPNPFVLPATPKESTSTSAPPSPSTPKKTHFSLSITSPLPDAKKAAAALKSPVLNLDGPVGDNEESGEDNPSQTTPTSPKKKRKRKRKKKHPSTADGAGTSGAS